MSDFQEIEKATNLREIIQEVFDLKLDVAGDWGYSKERAMIINDSTLPLKQLQHTLATIRAQIEMSLTLPHEEKYGSINVEEYMRESVVEQGKVYEVVHFHISAMLQSLYAKFIQEYKDGYGKEDFDIEKHFKEREINTISRDVKFWFIINSKES